MVVEAVKDPFIKSLDKEEGGMIKSLTFRDGRHLRGYRARLVHALSGNEGVDNAVPRSHVTQSVYGSESDFFYDRLNSLIKNVNEKVLVEPYGRKISFTPLSMAEKVRGGRADLYMEILQQSTGEVFQSRLAALRLLSEENPDIEKIIDELGPSKRGLRLTWWQACWSLGRHLPMLAERSIPGAERPAKATPVEQEVWDSLKVSVGDENDYVAARKMFAKLDAFKQKEKEKRRVNSGTVPMLLKEVPPLTTKERFLLGHWLNNKAMFIAEIYDINVLLLGETITDLFLDDEENPMDRNYNVDGALLQRAMEVVRSPHLDDLYARESKAGQKLLENLWLVDEYASGLDTIGHEIPDPFK